jgi:hypothetical protein
MKLLNTVKNFVETKFHLSNKQEELKKKYIDFGFNLVVNHFIPHLNDFVRHLIILKGKNPDYVSPPPEPTLNDVFKPIKYPLIPSQPSWVAASFKNPSKHPIYASRTALQEKNFVPTIEPMVADYLSAIDDLKSFLDTTDDSIFVGTSSSVTDKKDTTDIAPQIKSASPPVKPAKPKIKSKSEVKSKAKVSKIFNGSLRRVREE